MSKKKPHPKNKSSETLQADDHLFLTLFGGSAGSPGDSLAVLCLNGGSQFQPHTFTPLMGWSQMSHPFFLTPKRSFPDFSNFDLCTGSLAWQTLSSFNESETGIRGVKTYQTLEGGGGNRPESCPWKAWTFDTQIEGFLQNLCRKGPNSGTPENS